MADLPALTTMMSRLRLKQLHLLSALAEQGSLLRAAEKVALTQPGASKALREIESILGVTLFTRTQRGLVATDAGHCVTRYARLIQADLSHLREELADLTQGQGGRLAVGTIMGAVPLLAAALTRMRAQRADVAVEIVEDTSAWLLELLDSGRLDVAICRSSISAHPDLYDAVDVHTETLAVVGSADHPLASRQHLQLADLAQATWVVYSANMPMRRLLEREFHEADLRFPHNLYETTSAFTTLALLREQPDAVALLSTEVADFFTSFGMTRILPLQLASRSEPYQLVKRRAAVLSPAAELFIKIFRAGPQANRIEETQ